MNDTSGEHSGSSTTVGPALFTTFWLPPEEAFVGVRGDIDVCNAGEFLEYAWRDGRVNRLVVDLSECEFFGSAGYGAIHRLGERCVANGIRWALVPSRNVRRVVDICDEEATIPMHASVQAARQS